MKKKIKQFSISYYHEEIPVHVGEPNYFFDSDSDDDFYDAPGYQVDAYFDDSF